LFVFIFFHQIKVYYQFANRLTGATRPGTLTLASPAATVYRFDLVTIHKGQNISLLVSAQSARLTPRQPHAVHSVVL
jgi:hypothetical protein